MLQKKTLISDEIREMLKHYLELHHHRNTPERYAILEEIYTRMGHFDVEDLYGAMKDKKYCVSRATIYNTIELLLDASLIVKHQFNSKSAHFEKSFKSSQHDHLICTKCGTVQEFCDPRLHLIKTSIEKARKFTIVKHSLYFYGLCEKCK